MVRPLRERRRRRRRGLKIGDGVEIRNGAVARRAAARAKRKVGEVEVAKNKEEDGRGVEGNEGGDGDKRGKADDSSENS